MGTEVYSYAGVDLSTLGTYMEVVEGVDSAPPVRAQSGDDNLVIPFQHGRRWIQKYYDERPIVLKGNIFSQAGSRTDYEAKVDALKQLFAIGAGEQQLVVTRDSQIRYIMAEVRNTLGLQRTADWVGLGGQFSIELVASDPLWYGSALQSGRGGSAWTLDSGVLLDDGAHWFGPQTGALFAVTLTQQVTNIYSPNDGTAVNRKPVFTLTGAMTNPKITNLTNGYSVQLLGSCPAGSVVVIDCGLQRAQMIGLMPP